MKKNEVKNKTDDFWQIANDVVEGYERECDAVRATIPDDLQWTGSIISSYTNYDALNNILRTYCIPTVDLNHYCCDGATSNMGRDELYQTVNDRLIRDMDGIQLRQYYTDSYDLVSHTWSD